jgi:large conductance mechanosensitive channel
MGFIKEFREFAVKGNVMDLAVAVVLGTAFGAVVTGLTEGFIMPLVSMVTGKGGVEKLALTINGTIFPYGKFLQSVINFVLIAFVLFIVIKTMNSLKREKEEPAAGPKAPDYTLQEKLLMEIRDSLKK